MIKNNKQDLLAALRNQFECEQDWHARIEERIADLIESSRKRAKRIIEINKEIENLMRSK